MSTRISRDRAAAVDTANHWRLITPATPLGVKMLLINRASGVATLGALGTGQSWWSHWAPLPTWAKGEGAA